VKSYAQKKMQFAVEATIYGPGDVRLIDRDPFSSLELPDDAAIVALRVYEGPFRSTVKLDALLAADPNFDLCAYIPLKGVDGVSDYEIVARAAEKFIELWRDMGKKQE
jgi:hypothetical protein